MTISSETRKAGPFSGNNVTTTFPFTFKVFAETDVLVVKTDEATEIETVLVNITDYTVSLNADQNTSPGGSVTLPAALATGYLLTLSSSVPLLQAVDLTNTGGFYPAVINQALDRLTVFAQQLENAASRAVKVPISSTDDPDALIASVIAAAAAAAASADSAAASVLAAEAAIPTGTLGFTPVNITGDTMTGNLNVPGIKVGSSSTLTSLGNAATKTTGTTTGNVPLWESLLLNGSLSKAAAYEVAATDRGKLIDATTGTWSLTIAAGVLSAGFAFAVRNSGTGVITIDPNASELIDGAGTIALAAGESCLVVANAGATEWKTVGRPLGSACRAWVNFNGTGTVAIRASYNVSSIADDGTGRYTVNFITAMPDVNYAASVSAGSTVNDLCVAGLGNSASPPNMLVGSFNVTTVNGAGAYTDQPVICASVFR